MVHQPHPPLSRFVSWDTTPIQTVLDRALAKRPQDRFEDIGGFARALRAATDSSTDGQQPSAVEPVLRLCAPIADAPPTIKPPVVKARKVGHATFFGDEDLSRSINGWPVVHSAPWCWGSPFWGSPRSSDTGAGTAGPGGRVAETEHQLSRMAAEKWRALRSHGSVPAPGTAQLPIASRESEPMVKAPSPGAEAVPPRAPKDVAAGGEVPRPQVAARRYSARHFRPHGRATSHSGWQTIRSFRCRRRHRRKKSPLRLGLSRTHRHRQRHPRDSRFRSRRRRRPPPISPLLQRGTSRTPSVTSRQGRRAS